MELGEVPDDETAEVNKAESEVVRAQRTHGNLLWVALVLLPFVVLLLDWLPYFRMLKARRELMEHCTRGMPFAEYETWVKGKYPSVAAGFTSKGPQFVKLMSLGFPKSLMFALEHKPPFAAARRPLYTAANRYGFYIMVDTSGTIVEAQPYHL